VKAAYNHSVEMKSVSRASSESVTKRGRTLYDRKIRSEVETEPNIGKIISIDLETGDYEIDDDLLLAGKRLRERHPNAEIYGLRIGFDAVYGIGSTITQVAQ
jgi:hypothetical protein